MSQNQINKISPKRINIFSISCTN